MPRRLRFIPAPGTLVEVTCRILQGRMLLTPNPTLNRAIVGALARGQRRFGVGVCAVAYLSNHAHLLLRVDDARQLSQFMGLVQSKIAHEVKRHTGWDEKIWGRRYTAVLVSHEPAAQIARLRYVLSQSVKEHLVARCREWPGVHAAHALTLGQPLEGFWFDRSAEYEARRMGRPAGSRPLGQKEQLTFEPLPCWAGLRREVWQTNVASLIKSIESDAAVERRRTGIRPLGAQAVCRQDAASRPPIQRRSKAPLVHATSRAVRRVYASAFAIFVAAYRFAASRLAMGDSDVVFPPGSFPPAHPFVELSSEVSC